MNNAKLKYLKSLVGRKVRLISANNDSDFDDSKYNGSEGIIEHVDDMGQIHFSGCSIAIIPEYDDWELLD